MEFPTIEQEGNPIIQAPSMNCGDQVTIFMKETDKMALIWFAMLRQGKGTPLYSVIASDMRIRIDKPLISIDRACASEVIADCDVT